MDKWTALRPCPLTHRPVITKRDTGPIYTLDGTHTSPPPALAILGVNLADQLSAMAMERRRYWRAPRGVRPGWSSLVQ